MVLARGEGLDGEVAKKLHDDLMPSIQSKLHGFPQALFEKAFTFLELPSHRHEILRNAGAEGKSREVAAAIFETTTDNIHCQRSYLIVYTKIKKPFTSKPEKEAQDKVMVILALGDLDKNNGLPDFEDSKSQILRSGQLLGASLDKSQTFGGRGGGLGYVWIWAYGPMMQEASSDPSKP